MIGRCRKANWTGNDYLDALYDQLDGLVGHSDAHALCNWDLTAAELIETGFYEVGAATSITGRVVHAPSELPRLAQA